MLQLQMESLLCDEVLFDSSPRTDCDEEDDMHVVDSDYRLLTLDDQTAEEFTQAFTILLKKEDSYLPCPGYVDHVNSNPSIRKERATALCWLVKSQRRLGFSLGTLFNAANYLDRFISNNKCQDWNSWMFELLSIACLSVAAKFNETSTPPLCEFQEDDLGHYFEWRVIQRMELTLLKTIGWRLTPSTPFSYVEMLSCWSLRSMNSFINRVTQLLLQALLDYKYLEFRPFAISMSAIKFASEEMLLPKNRNAVLQHFYHSCVIQDYRFMEELLKCQEMMRKNQPIEGRSLLDYYCWNNNTYRGDEHDDNGPSSPVTVLLTTTNSSCCGGKRNFGASDLIIKRTTQIISNNFSPSKRMKKEERVV